MKKPEINLAGKTGKNYFDEHLRWQVVSQHIQ